MTQENCFRDDARLAVLGTTTTHFIWTEEAGLRGLGWSKWVIVSIGSGVCGTGAKYTDALTKLGQAVITRLLDRWKSVSH